jgi:hypothetical protein
MQKYRKNRFILLIACFLIINQPYCRAHGEGFFHNVTNVLDSDTKKLIIESSIQSFSNILVYVVTFSFVYLTEQKTLAFQSRG